MPLSVFCLFPSCVFENGIKELVFFWVFVLSLKFHFHANRALCKV